MIPSKAELTAAEPLGEMRRRRTWRDWLWVIAFGAVQWPWLLRSLSGGSAAAREALAARVGLPAGALARLGGWRADAYFLNLIVDQIGRLRPRTVVELGAGATTLVIACALKRNGGGRLVSYEHDAAFAAGVAEEAAAAGIEADVRHAPLRRNGGETPWYAIGAPPAEIDLLVIDGPPWAQHPLIRGGAERLFDRVAVGGVVLLDDAARLGERWAARRWRRRWPGFEFTRVGGPAGTLIGVRRA